MEELQKLKNNKWNSIGRINVYIKKEKKLYINLLAEANKKNIKISFLIKKILIDYFDK